MKVSTPTDVDMVAVGSYYGGSSVLLALRQYKAVRNLAYNAAFGMVVLLAATLWIVCATGDRAETLRTMMFLIAGAAALSMVFTLSKWKKLS